jgi:membrane fusion protein, multidrug efflux system
MDFLVTLELVALSNNHSLMASKAIYTAVAVAGIAAASAAAWWYQRPPHSADGARSLAANAAPPAVSSPQLSASGAAAGGKPPAVEVAQVEVARLVDDTQAVGSLRSRRGVVLRPEVSGRITQLNFADGQRVRKGQVLVQFDDQLPLAQVQQSQAELSIAQANQKRNQELVSENFISKRSLDESAANLQVAQAKLALAKATAARLRIVAPFDGIAGIRQVNVGDYLKDGSDIVNIEDLEALYVDFRLPERFQSKISRGQSAMLGIDALPGRTYMAQIQAIDPLIDANGRSVGVRGCVDNRLLQLRPGMFARVNTVFGVRENARVIPEEAIVPQGGKQYVIKLLGGAGEARTSRRVEVKVGLRTPGKVEIVDGLEAGETVVISGQQRVQKDGTQVSVVEVGVTASGRTVRSPSAPASAAESSFARALSPAQPAVSEAEKSTLARSTAAVASAAKAVKPEASPAGLSGPNPCGAALADASLPARVNSAVRAPAPDRPRPVSRDPA